MNVRAGSIVSVNLMAGALCWFLVLRGAVVELFSYMNTWPVGMVCSSSRAVEVSGRCRCVIFARGFYN